MFIFQVNSINRVQFVFVHHNQYIHYYCTYHLRIMRMHDILFIMFIGEPYIDSMIVSLLSVLLMFIGEPYIDSMIKSLYYLSSCYWWTIYRQHDSLSTICPSHDFLSGFNSFHWPNLIIEVSFWLLQVYYMIYFISCVSNATIVLWLGGEYLYVIISPNKVFGDIMVLASPPRLPRRHEHS